MNDPVKIAAAAAAGLALLAFFVLFFRVLRLWVPAFLVGAPVSIGDIARMRRRRIPPELVVHAVIHLRGHGVTVTAREVEECYLAHGAGSATTPLQLATLVLEKRGGAG